jgi:hypothetical protein
MKRPSSGSWHIQVDGVFIARYTGEIRRRNRAQLVIISMRLSIRNPTTRKLHFADIQGVMMRIDLLVERHNALEIDLYVNRTRKKRVPMATDGGWSVVLVNVGDRPQ